MERDCQKCKSTYKTSYQGRRPVCSACRKYFVQNSIWNINYNTIAMGGSTYATNITKSMGANAEIKFASICRKLNNYRIRGSTKYEEIKLHYDFVIEITKKEKIEYNRIEVKAMKSRNRGKSVDPTITYLEYKNVIGGPGWIYGSSDYIAFEQPSHFLVVYREDLVTFAEKAEKTMKLSKKSGIINTLYSRRNRKDLIGCFLTTDIIKNNRHFLLSNKIEKKAKC